jgi:hypothetical protein
MRYATSESIRAAIQSVRDGAQESVELYDPSAHGGCMTSYVRDRRGIVYVVSGPNGERLVERLVERVIERATG